ncbi:unnamed protein product, partial [Heterotrigona itama]
EDPVGEYELLQLNVLGSYDREKLGACLSLNITSYASFSWQE